MTQKITLFKKSYFKNLIEKQEFLTHPYAASVWDDMVTHKDTRKEMKKDPDFKVFSSYITSRFAYEHAKLFDAKLRGGAAKERADKIEAKLQEKASVEEQIESLIGLEQLIKEDINQHSSQEDKIKAIRRWKGAAVLLWKRENYEGYSLVCQALASIDKKLKDLANDDTSAEEHLEIREILGFYIREDITKHESQSAQINAFHRWMETALILMKKHDNPEGYLLVRDNLRSIDKELDLTKNKAFKPYLKMYQQLFQPNPALDAALIDYELRKKYVALSLEDFRNPKGLECFNKASPNLKAYLNFRESLHKKLIKEINEAKGDDKIKVFCHWVDILLELKNKHNYEALVYLGIYLQTVDKVMEEEGFPKSYREKYEQIVRTSNPSGLKDRMDQDQSPYKFTSIFSVSRKLILIEGNIESIKMRLDEAVGAAKKELNQSYATLCAEKSKGIEHIPGEIKNSEKSLIGSSTTPKHLQTKFDEVREAFNKEQEAYGNSREVTAVISPS